MRLRALELDEFRSFRRLVLPIDPAGFRAIGPNASGKSTILEAIAMLATTRSPRTAAEREIAHWDSGVDLAVPPYARLRGEFERSDGIHQLEIGITLHERGQSSLKKIIRFDDRPVRAVDAVGQFTTVHFSPEDVNLVSGAPSARRRYLDVAISQSSRPYLRALSRYGRVLVQRNSLLRSISRDRFTQDPGRPARELPFWDAELTAAATDVLAYRMGAIEALSGRAEHYFELLTGDASLTITYASPRMDLPEDMFPVEDWRAPPQSLRQTLSATFSRSLGTYAVEELRRGITVIGPHRDDIVIWVNGVDLARYGSRGQQRLAVVAIKLAELDLLGDAVGEPPVLLLDDVLSELDVGHRSMIVSTIAGRNAQVCVTATDELDLASPVLAHLPVLRTSAGAVETLGAD
ncbi:MAG TPA: DNA replication and repair protein RecF [Thermomicrobiales bacterium]|nr:DNA replication and repair protein RecF [Thermomicrobiales bacterium]